MFRALMSVTREQWVTAILEGRDLLKAEDLMAYLQRDTATDDQKRGAQEYGKSIAVFLRGHGDSQRVVETNDTPEKLAVFENRSIERPDNREMTMKEASDFALHYFRMVDMMKRFGRVI